MDTEWTGPARGIRLSYQQVQHALPFPPMPLSCQRGAADWQFRIPYKIPALPFHSFLSP